MYCDTFWCKYFYKFWFNRAKVNFFYAENKMSYTYDPWYFFGNDFTFSDAFSNFEYLEALIPTYKNT